MKYFYRCVARILIVCTMALGAPLPASADMVSTEQLQAGGERDRIKTFLEREEVRDQLQSMGVDADAARARVDALTDEEAHNLAGRIDALPAGGEIIGVLFAVFIILLVTDILGLTKVFPFTRSVR